ncbi:MAG: hypothetical protein V7607_2492 [Solirubrobacteraceae bacterium]
MRERFDAGTGLVAIGAVLLLVSLFIDWYRPGGDAWAVFESIDLLLAGAAISALLAMAPRLGDGGLGRAVPIISAAAFVVVAVQLIDPPPVVSDADLRTGAWLALAATATMAAGSLLGAASISVTVDVRGRERRRRAAAIDARDGAGEVAEEDASSTRRRFRRDEPLLGPHEPAVPSGSTEDPDRTQTFDPIEPANE